MTGPVTGGPVRSFADFKKRLAVGMDFQCEHHERPNVSGRRHITKVQTNGVFYSFTTVDGATKTGWTQWPKAADVTVLPDGDGITRLRDGVPLFTYRLEAVR